MREQLKHEVNMRIAFDVARLATCRRRHVGCVIVDGVNRVIATGYNGSPRGAAHCSTAACPGALAPSGTALDKCVAIHAEQNAVMQCADVMLAHAIYVTTFPCPHCLKILMNTGAKQLFYAERYSDDDLTGIGKWDALGRYSRLLIPLNE